MTCTSLSEGGTSLSAAKGVGARLNTPFVPQGRAATQLIKLFLRGPESQMKPMFRIKICGITNVDDALEVLAAGADAVGLNFYHRSPRYVRFEQAQDIVNALPSDFLIVGVFVNAAIRRVCQIFDQLELGLIQLHGDETPEFLAGLGARPVIRAFRPGPDGLRPVSEYLQQCRQLGCLPQMTLIDSHQKGKYGGTGRVADWTLAAQYHADRQHPPLVLAGGLTPDNVAQAIRTVRPAAVDTAGGVESSPQRKDPSAIREFVRAARQAFTV